MLEGTLYFGSGSRVRRAGQRQTTVVTETTVASPGNLVEAKPGSHMGGHVNWRAGLWEVREGDEIQDPMTGRWRSAHAPLMSIS